jgi:hypothetical protein
VDGIEMDLGLVKVLVLLLPGVVAYIIADRIVVGHLKTRDLPYQSTLTFLSFSAIIVTVYYCGIQLILLCRHKPLKALASILNGYMNSNVAIDQSWINALPWLFILACLVGLLYGFAKNRQYDKHLLEFLHVFQIPDKTAWDKLFEKLTSKKEPAYYIQIRLADKYIRGKGELFPANLEYDKNVFLNDVVIYEKTYDPAIPNWWHWGELQHVQFLFINLDNPAIISVELILP